MQDQRFASNGMLYWIGLLIFLGISGILGLQFTEQHKQRLIEHARSKARQDLQLIRGFVQKALQKQNYQDLSSIIRNFGAMTEDTLAIRLTAANGFVLAQYQRDRPGAPAYPLSASIPYFDNRRASLRLSKDFSAPQAQIGHMRIAMASAAALITLLFILLSWELARRRRATQWWRHTADELKQTQQRLTAANHERQRMRNYLDAALDAIPSILIGVDPNGRITEWNKAAEEHARIKREDAVSLAVTDLMPQLRQPYENIRAAIDKAQPPRPARVITISGGIMRYVQIHVSPLSPAAGAGAIIRLDDTTERVYFECMMVQTEKFSALSGLAAGMADEVNSPLSGVLQNCQNIQRRLSAQLPANQPAAQAAGIDLERLDSYLQQREIPQLLRLIQTAAERASLIVADMLAFNRRSAGNFEKIAVDALLDTAVRLASHDRQMKKKLEFGQIDIIRDSAPTPLLLACDRTRIEQVLLNLLKNAAQAMAAANTPAPRTITLRTRGDEQSIQIDVEDNGPGIKGDVKHGIFAPIYHATEANLGLGLAVAHFIITEQHQGMLRVHSTPGAGTRVSLHLPADGRGGGGGFSAIESIS
jgi:PAS domain S-box-containing protein